VVGGGVDGGSLRWFLYLLALISWRLFCVCFDLSQICEVMVV